jgi:phytoene desaturase
MAHTEQTPRVVVIGAGLGGLSAAIRLAHAGYHVDVFEKQSGPGGKAFSEQIGAYRFDTGPSLFTLQPVFAQLFEETGRSMDDYATVTPLERICRYFWRDGARMESLADPDRFADQFQRAFGEDPAHLRSFLRYSEQIHRVTSHLFLERSLHEWSTVFTGEFWRSVGQLGKIDAFRTMDRANGAFFRNARVRQFFNRYATYNGSDPYQTPATLNIIPHVEYGLGAWSVAGGIYAIPRALERLAGDVGVRLHYGVTVEEILTTGRPGLRGRIGSKLPGSRGRARVRGVRVDGVEHPAEIVISNADVTPTYERLLGDTRAPLYKRYQRLEPSSSGLVFYWGVRKRFPELGLHNIFFSDDYRSEFNAIFQQHRCPDDPTIYLNITVKDGAPEDAPADGENWFVLVNAPADRGQDWQGEAQRVREAVLKRLSRELGTEIEAVLEEEAQMTPSDIAAKTDSHRGSLYGIASNTRGAAFLRHPNRSRRYRGLFFVGGSAHPGGGMPLVVLGGRIVADLVRRHHSLGGETR